MSYHIIVLAFIFIAKIAPVTSGMTAYVSAFAKFDRMREKVEHAKAQADAMRELMTTDDLDK